LGVAATDDVFARLAEVLADHPLLVVDDVHLLDDATATVLHQVARAGLATLVLTAHPDDGVPLGARGLLALDGLELVDVGPLDAPDLRDLARRLVGGPIEGWSLHRRLAQRLARPGVLDAVVRSSTAAGVLTHDGLVHRLVADPVLGPALDGRVAGRLAGLADDTRLALEAVVVAGELDLDVAADLVPPSAVEALERGGLVRSDAGRSRALTVVDPVVAAWAGQRLGAVTRRRLNRGLAAAADRVGHPERVPRSRFRPVTWAHRGGLGPDGPALAGAARESEAAGEILLAAELAAAFAEQQDPGSALFAAWCYAREARRDAGVELLAAALEVTDDPWAGAHAGPAVGR